MPKPTQQQLKVIHLLSMGKTPKAIAPEMGLSTYTVQGHVTQAMKRVEAANSVALVAMSLRKGWVT